MSFYEDVPDSLTEYNGNIPNRAEPKSVYTNEAGEIYHAVKLHGVYKDATGWHIKEGETRTEFINYGNNWKGSSYYRKSGYTKKNKAHYSRVRSGILRGEVNEERIDFLTLSTQYDKYRPQDRLKKLCQH